MKEKINTTTKGIADIKKMEYAIHSFAKAAIHATDAISMFSEFINQIEAIKKERKRKRRQFIINWIKYYLLFEWIKNQ